MNCIKYYIQNILSNFKDIIIINKYKKWEQQLMTLLIPDII